MMKNAIRHCGRACQGIYRPAPKHLRPQSAIGANIQSWHKATHRAISPGILLAKNDPAGRSLKPNLECERLIGRAGSREMEKVIRQRSTSVNSAEDEPQSHFAGG